jgi:hypothetical protein
MAEKLRPEKVIAPDAEGVNVVNVQSIARYGLRLEIAKRGNEDNEKGRREARSGRGKVRKKFALRLGTAIRNEPAAELIGIAIAVNWCECGVREREEYFGIADKCLLLIRRLLARMLDSQDLVIGMGAPSNVGDLAEIAIDCVMREVREMDRICNGPWRGRSSHGYLT